MFKKLTILFSLLFLCAISTNINQTYAANGNSEYVYIDKVDDMNDKAIVIRKNGDAYGVEYGVGVLSIWMYEGRLAVINSPGLFAGVGSYIVLPDEQQEAIILDSTYLGNVYANNSK